MRIKLYGKTFAVTMQTSNYSNGRIAIVFYNAETGEPVVKATTNLVGEEIAYNEIAVANVDGLYDELVRLKVITGNRRVVRPAGSHVDFTIATLS